MAFESTYTFTPNSSLAHISTSFAFQIAIIAGLWVRGSLLNHEWTPTGLTSRPVVALLLWRIDFHVIVLYWAIDIISLLFQLLEVGKSVFQGGDDLINGLTVDTEELESKALRVTFHALALCPQQSGVPADELLFPWVIVEAFLKVLQHIIINMMFFIIHVSSPYL